MKVCLLDVSDKLSSHVIRLAREVGWFLEERPKAIDLYVFIGDGSPDDILLSALLLSMNHERVAGLVKPRDPGVVALARSLALVLEKSRVAAVRAMLVVDQNDTPLGELMESARRALGDAGFSCGEPTAGERFMFLICDRGGRRAGVALVVNGLDEFPIAKHEAEDHLLILARELGYSVGDLTAGSSKEAWLLLSRRLGIKPYQLLAKALKRGFSFRGVMPQHYVALEKLMAISF